MVLAVYVVLGTLLAWSFLLYRRRQEHLPLTEEVCYRAFYAAFEFGGAIAGALLPMAWIFGSNILGTVRTGTWRFVLTDNLPPGMEEQDLVALLFVGTVNLILRGFFTYRRHLREADPR